MTIITKHVNITKFNSIQDLLSYLEWLLVFPWMNRLQPLTLRNICVTCATTYSQLKASFDPSARNANH